MVKKIKNAKFEGGFIVTGTGDSAKVQLKPTKEFKPKPIQKKKLLLEKTGDEYTDPEGWWWYKFDPNTKAKIVSRIKVGKLKYKVQHELGRGKDGVTYFCTHDENPSVVIKMLSGYGRKYWHRYETIRQRIEKSDLRDDTIVKQVLKFPQHGNKGPQLFKGDTVMPPTTYYYRLDEPYKEYSPVTKPKEWIKGLLDIAKLQEALLTEKLAVWDLGFKSGLNYMRDTNERAVWVDFGGNAFAVPKESNKNTFNRWIKYEPDIDYQTKPQLGALTSNMLRWYFLLHLEFHHFGGWNIHDLNFISTIASALQTSSRFEDFLDPNVFNWRFDLIKSLLHETDGLDWTAPKTWETVRAVMERYIATRES